MSINFDICERFAKSLVSDFLTLNGRFYPIEIKASSTIMPSHIHNLNQWKELAGDMAAGRLVIADIGESFDIKGAGSCHGTHGRI
jgi:hypothetical protein